MKSFIFWWGFAYKMKLCCFHLGGLAADINFLARKKWDFEVVRCPPGHSHKFGCNLGQGALAIAFPSTQLKGIW